MAEDYKPKIVSHKKVIMQTDYSSYVPTPPKSRFTPITLKPIIPLYTDALKDLREETKKMKKFKNTMKELGLERKLEFAVALGSVIVSMLYFSTNLTSFAIGNLNQTDINIVGAVFFVCGVFGILTGLRRR